MSMTGRTAGRVIVSLVAAILATTLGLPTADASPKAVSEAGFASAINEERKAEKLDGLVVNPALTEIAREWSGVMARARDLRHNDSLRKEIEQHVTKEWKRIGENVGYTRKSGATDAELVERLHQAFMDSPGHRANVLGSFNQVGVGVRRNSDGTMWVTAVFMDGPLPKVSTPPVGPSGFTDVGGVHADNIAVLAEAGIAAGYGDGSFRPKNPVSRGQMAKFIGSTRGLEPRESGPFDDTAGTTFRREINALVHAGIAGGYPDGTYRPHGTVTRGQMAKFIVAARGLEPRESGPFDDTSESTFRGEINALVHAGIADGFADGTYRPNRTVTRGQMASFLTEAFSIGK